MRAMKCDRCGKYYECYAGQTQFKGGERANALYLIDRDLGKNYCYWKRRICDLCPECMEQFERFVRGGAVSAAEKEEVT